MRASAEFWREMLFYRRIIKEILEDICRELEGVKERVTKEPGKTFKGRNSRCKGLEG